MLDADWGKRRWGWPNGRAGDFLRAGDPPSSGGGYKEANGEEMGEFRRSQIGDGRSIGKGAGEAEEMEDGRWQFGGVSKIGDGRSIRGSRRGDGGCWILDLEFGDRWE